MGNESKAGSGLDHSKWRGRPAHAYEVLDPLPWDKLVKPLVAAEDALARLDERLSKSVIRDGWSGRAHFAEACASLWLDGELVHVEDLVLHDAMMDVRTPTAELVRAHSVLRARRRIASAARGWALSPSGLDTLRGRTPAPYDGPAGDRIAVDEDWEEAPPDAEWAKALAAVDAAMARSERLLSGEPSQIRSPEDRPSLVYDLDWDEEARLGEWRRIIEATRSVPASLAAAIAVDAWNEIEPLQGQAWLGRLLAAEILRSRGKTRAYIPTLCVGLKSTPQQRRWKRDPLVRIQVVLEALSEAASAGLKEHDRLATTYARLGRRIEGRRSNSRLPELRDLAIASPLVTGALIAGRLGVTQRGALTFAQDLGLREATGRKRYRAWEVV